MRVLAPIAHGSLDYVLVAIFLLAPSVVDFGGPAALLAYALGLVHLAVTLATAFPLGLFRVIPMAVHGAIEVVVALLLVVLPWRSGDALPFRAGIFFTAAGLVIFALWLVSDMRGARARSTL